MNSGLRGGGPLSQSCVHFFLSVVKFYFGTALKSRGVCLLPQAWLIQSVTEALSCALCTCAVQQLFQ